MSGKLKETPISGKIWFSAIFFGLIGQIAWIVENMYFATFAQDVFANSGRSDMSYVVTTLMVILSAIAATVTTIFAGAWSDKAGKRKPFISIGYIFWGITIMLFAFLPMKASAKSLVLIAVLIVLFDCIMTFAGSTSNDAAFNAWVADNTDETNRGKINGILSILPVIAVVIVFVGLGNLYNSANESNALFFIVLGSIPIASGILALFLLKDSDTIKKSENSISEELFFGFKKETFKANKMLYIILAIGSIAIVATHTYIICEYSARMSAILENIKNSDSEALCIDDDIVKTKTHPSLFLSQEDMLAGWVLPVRVYDKTITFCD